ncbi:MAG: LPS export ABC transporter periplasmic protein LptC [Candidatus Lernaella stagnicola]|nr:LPS export ABC transporter periplasmic protein LptC [Candidatus Lernaella stagnicola]
MRFSPTTKLGTLLGVLLVAGLIWQLCQSDKPLKKTSERQKDFPFGEMADFVYTRTVNGQVQYRAAAARARYFDNRNTAELEQVTGEVVESGRRFEIRGDTAGVDMTARTGVLRGNVVARTEDGLELRTDDLQFDGATSRISTDAAVRLVGPSFTVAGIGADIDIDGQRVKLREQVKAKLWSQDN